MGDAELVSELLAAMIKGHQDKKKSLNSIYAEFDDCDEDWIEEWETKFKKNMKLILDIMGDDARSTRFVNKNDFYSLFVVLHELTQERKLKIAQTNQVAIFSVLVMITLNVSKDAQIQEFLEWYMNVNSAGDTLSSRRQRHNTLISLIEPFCLPLDKKRHFSEFDKRLIWHQSKDKTCAICNKTIPNYSDYEPDHIIPWNKGGASVISNGQLAHMSCNRAKGDRI